MSPLPAPPVAYSTVTGILPGWISVTSGTRGPERLNSGLRQRGQSRVKIRAPGAASCKRGRCARLVHLARRPLRLHGALPASPLLLYRAGSPGLSAGVSNLKLPGKWRGTRGRAPPPETRAPRRCWGAAPPPGRKEAAPRTPLPSSPRRIRVPFLRWRLTLCTAAVLPRDGKAEGHFCSSFARSGR